MKVKLKFSKKYNYVLVIKKRFGASKFLIPIGCDCHPAYMLKSLNLRKQSLPFDWLDTKPLFGLKYVYENIVNKFNFFLLDLKINNENKVISSKYPFAVFYHFNDLISNKNFQIKLKNRCENLLQIINNKPICYINTVTSKSLNNDEAILFYYNSIVEFSQILKAKDTLLIYLRYDDTFEENTIFCEDLVKKVNIYNNNVKIVNYLREEKKYGIWGDEKKYSQLIKRMGIKLFPKFPKITISKIN